MDWYWRTSMLWVDVLLADVGVAVLWADVGAMGG
jgi:hypothetical protein